MIDLLLVRQMVWWMCLYRTYLKPFQIALNPTITVSRAFTHTSITIQFTKQLTGTLLAEWNLLTSSLPFSSVFANISLLDKIVWRWHSSGQFTVKSLYKWLEYRGIKNSTYTTLWKTKFPLKIKIFLWLVRQCKILTKDNLAKNGWIEDQTCAFCNSLETIDHFFVTYPVISSIWTWIASQNNFTFNCEHLDDIWLLDA